MTALKIIDTNLFKKILCFVIASTLSVTSSFILMLFSFAELSFGVMSLPIAQEKCVSGLTVLIFNFEQKGNNAHNVRC